MKIMKYKKTIYYLKREGEMQARVNRVDRVIALSITQILKKYKSMIDNLQAKNN